MLDARNVQSECSSDICSGGQGARTEKKQAVGLTFQASVAVHLSQKFPLSALWGISLAQDALFDLVPDSLTQPCEPVHCVDTGTHQEP
jgi:hypothetical protein